MVFGVIGHPEVVQSLREDVRALGARITPFHVSDLSTCGLWHPQGRGAHPPRMSGCGRRVCSLRRLWLREGSGAAARPWVCFLFPPRAWSPASLLESPTSFSRSTSLPFSLAERKNFSKCLCRSNEQQRLIQASAGERKAA